MKKNINIILVLMLLCAFACGAFSACGDGYTGLYRHSSDSGSEGAVKTLTYIELKSGSKCSIYQLRGGASKDHLDEGVNLFKGTYKVKDQKITFSVKWTDPVSNEKKSQDYVGEMLSNNRIRVTLFGGQKTFTKSS